MNKPLKSILLLRRFEGLEWQVLLGFVEAEAAVQLRLLERLEGFRLPGLVYHGQPFATTLLR